MLPNLSEGDLIIYKSIKAKDLPIKEGTLVVTNHPLEQDSLLIKRVYKSFSFGVELRGDNEYESIDSRQFGIVKNECIKGIVEETFHLS